MYATIVGFATLQASIVPSILSVVLKCVAFFTQPMNGLTRLIDTDIEHEGQGFGCFLLLGVIAVRDMPRSSTSELERFSLIADR